MRLRINASSIAQNRWLQVDSAGVTILETALVGGRKTVPFRNIVCILMSGTHELSVQYGQEVFSVPTKPGDKQHEETIAALVREVHRAHGRPVGGAPA